MSQENIDVILKAVEALNRRDADAFAACVSPDVEWETNRKMVGLGGTYRGRAGVRDFFEDLFGLETWESIDVEVEEVTEASDDRVLAGMLARTRGRGSGVPTELHLWQVFWFAESLITRRQVFWTRQEALEAAGLWEERFRP
jgi:ketosteroid isomerase-like protein